MKALKKKTSIKLACRLHIKDNTPYFILTLSVLELLNTGFILEETFLIHFTDTLH